DAQIRLENMRRAKAQGFISRRTAFRFFAEFRDGYINLKDQLRSGRPREVDREAIIEATEEDPA
ncbi:hypothetical protein KIN20_035773, partial [Parelaphostrongylus tenuis]